MFGVEASKASKSLVEGKQTRLEKDVSETDKYDRLLRYSWLGNVMVNDYLVRQGFAQADARSSNPGLGVHAALPIHQSPNQPVPQLKPHPTPIA